MGAAIGDRQLHASSLAVAFNTASRVSYKAEVWQARWQVSAILAKRKRVHIQSRGAAAVAFSLAEPSLCLKTGFTKERRVSQA